MALATWWRGDHLPALASSKDFCAARTGDAELLAQLAHLDVEEVQKRLSEGHQPYVAWCEHEAVAYGWVATQSAHIGELDLSITLPIEDRYLWDFATLPAWRGRGLYPRLLQAIVTSEPARVERFWIIAAPENRASRAGIAKAGFNTIAELSFLRVGQPGLVQINATERALVAAALLQVPLLYANPRQVLSPCWHCAIDAREAGRAMTEVACWPAEDELLVTACCCG